ncbi:glycosyltransferase family 4 protein [Stieleria sp. TO1_6]|uniref:glycosyltransferase family 4 protein n=1 Tax=Stieleria tagensis TaxID=2956795 RepID=UPI00209BA1FC|nr:glycosyltransferase family 4 protein [Stieleria tagensis]MCO8123450.1 glycosyltransferase family 4 protein [Stieleria tagensis]
MPKARTPTRVAVTYRVCQHWRAHIFAKLNARDDLSVSVLHGQSIPGTKCINGDNLKGFSHREHFSIRVPFTKTWAVQPTIFSSLRELDPDVILAEGGSNLLTNFFVLLYAKLYSKPVVWWTLGELRGASYRGLVRGTYRKLVVFQERLCDVYLGYSTIAMEYFRKMGFADEDCFLAVNCVDTNRVIQQIAIRHSQAEQLAEEIGVKGLKVILFVGAFTQAKRIDRLIRVFASIQSEVPDAVLVLVGDGSSKESIEKQISKLHLEEKVILTGSVVENVSDYYELGDVFVLPGLGGLAISEAMAHRMPVICTFADGCEVDYVVDDQTGYRLFSDDDSEVEEFLREKLLLVLSDDGLRERLSKTALSRIETVHNVDTYIQGIVDAIHYAENKSIEAES